MKAVESISHFSQLSPWQGATLWRLVLGLAFSVAVHICLGLWLAQPVERITAAQPTPSQRLEIHLVDKHPADLKQKSVLAHIQNARPLAEPTAPMASGETPAWIPTPTASDETYFAPEEVEQMAYVVNVEELPLPENSQTPGGAVYLKVMINESGSADKIDIVTSTLPEEYAKTLVSSFYQAKFSPALIAGQPTRSWRIIEIRLDLPESIAG